MQSGLNRVFEIGLELSKTKSPIRGSTGRHRSSPLSSKCKFDRRRTPST